DTHSVRRDVHIEHRDAAARRGQKSQENSNECALSGAVRADEPDDARFEIDRQRIESDDAGIALRQLACAYERHLVDGRDCPACNAKRLRLASGKVTEFCKMSSRGATRRGIAFLARSLNLPWLDSDPSLRSG